MALLERSVNEYVLCDLDADSIASLQHQARTADVADLTWCIQDEGIAALWERTAALADKEAARTLVHIDPFEPNDSSGRSGLSALDLCCGAGPPGLGLADRGSLAGPAGALRQLQDGLQPLMHSAMRTGDLRTP